MKTIVIEAPRQAGKSTILNNYIKSYINSNVGKRIAVCGANTNMLKVACDGLYPDGGNQNWIYAKTKFDVSWGNYDLIVIDELSYMDPKHAAGMLGHALTYDKDLVVTINQGSGKKLTYEVANILNHCIVASATNEKNNFGKG